MAAVGLLSAIVVVGCCCGGGGCSGEVGRVEETRQIEDRLLG